jgi:hypothetical protein
MTRIGIVSKSEYNTIDVHWSIDSLDLCFRTPSVRMPIFGYPYENHGQAHTFSTAQSDLSIAQRIAEESPNIHGNQNASAVVGNSRDVYCISKEVACQNQEDGQ